MMLFWLQREGGNGGLYGPILPPRGAPGSVLRGEVRLLHDQPGPERSVSNQIWGSVTSSFLASPSTTEHPGFVPVEAGVRKTTS